MVDQKMEQVSSLQEVEEKTPSILCTCSSSLEIFKKIIRHPRGKKGIQALGVLAISGASILSSIPLFEKNSVQAESGPEIKPTNTLLRPPNPYFFTDTSGRQVKIIIEHGTSPLLESPNPSDKGIDTIYVYTDNILTTITQPNGPLHPAFTQLFWASLADNVLPYEIQDLISEAMQSQ